MSFLSLLVRVAIDEEGGSPMMEQLLIIAATGVPVFSAILLLEDVLREYLEFETAFVTSPFF